MNPDSGRRATARLGLAAAAVASVVPPAPSQLPPGVTPEVREAIDRGLQWLVQRQSTDGAFREAGGHGSYPAAMTGLAGMAFVASGASPTRGRHFAVVRDGIAFLLRHADPQHGLIAVPREDGHAMYGHGFATLFLASVHGMEVDVQQQQRLRGVLDRAVDLIQAAQTPAGGWNYQPQDAADEGSVTVTQLQALRACRMAGIAVDKKTIDRAVDYVRRSQNSDGGIRYRLGMAGESRPAITAAGIAVLYNAGRYDDQNFTEAAVRFCHRQLGRDGQGSGHGFYAHLYWSQVLWQRGGDEWADYYAGARAWLLRAQRRDGGWDGDGVGPVYGTAIALVLLQLPYAMVPIYQR